MCGLFAVGIETLSLHRNPAFWDNPDVFDPSRFLGEKPSMYKFLPFSVGNRNCIGFNFALTEIRVAVSQLLRRFKFLPEDVGGTGCMCVSVCVCACVYACVCASLSLSLSRPLSTSLDLSRPLSTSFHICG